VGTIMDDAAFDRLARTVDTRRGVVAGLAALFAGGPLLAEARRRRECGANRPCADGFACNARRCVCASGVTCAGACCAVGETCRDGACTPPEPDCLAFGAACKGAGVPCCDGLACGSGQGGADVSCRVPAGGPCDATAQCTYGASCVDGACTVAPEPAPSPTPEPVCDLVAGPDAVANGLALMDAIAAAPSGATLALGGGVYDIVNGTGWSIQVARDLALTACGTGLPRIRMVTATRSQRGFPGGLFSAEQTATLSLTGLALSWVRGSFTGYGFSVTGAARLILKDTAVERFDFAIDAVGDGRVELRGGVRITGSSVSGIVLEGTSASPDLSRIACSGAGNAVTGSGSGNCVWQPGGPTPICPTGCGCACSSGLECIAQVCRT